MEKETRLRIEREAHAAAWEPVGTFAATNEVCTNDVCLGGIVRQFPGERYPYSETRLIVEDGKVRRGALMNNTPEQALQIPTWLRRRMARRAS